MSSAPGSTSARRAGSSAARRDAALVTLVAALLLLPGIGGIDLFDPDEPREAQITLEMMASGNRAVPTFDDCPFLQKPPLFYWVAGALLAIPGISREVAVRLPSVLAIWGLSLVTYELGRRLSHRRTGRAAAVLLLTMHLPFWLGRRALLDPMLAFFAGACILAAIAAAGRPRLLLLAGLAATGAVMTKGPIGLLVPALAIGADALMRGELRSYLRPAAIPAALLPLLAFGGWLGVLAAEPEGACFVNEVLVENAARRFTGSPTRGHQQPPWYYATQLAIAFLPWSLLLPSAIRSQWLGRRIAPADGAARLGFAWLVPNLALLSAASTKRGIYLLPLAPAVALLVASWWRHRGRAGREGRWLRLPALALLGVGIVAALAIPAAATALRDVPSLADVVLARVDWSPTPALLLPVGAGLALLAIVAAIAKRSPRRAAGAALGAAVIANVAIGAWILPLASRHLSARAFGTTLAGLRTRGLPVLVLDVNEGHLGQFLVYGGSTLPWAASKDRDLPRNCIDCRDRREAAEAIAAWDGAVLMMEPHYAKLPPELRGQTLRVEAVGSDRYVLFLPPRR